jgi:hypothetical protein
MQPQVGVIDYGWLAGWLLSSAALVLVVDLATGHMRAA